VAEKKSEGLLVDVQPLGVAGLVHESTFLTDVSWIHRKFIAVY
jgi:hypothetical protein